MARNCTLCNRSKPTLVMRWNCQAAWVPKSKSVCKSRLQPLGFGGTVCAVQQRPLVDKNISGSPIRLPGAAFWSC